MASQFDISTLSLQDVLDMAVLIEKEAEERYLVLAKQVGKRYPGDAADFFTMMAQNEQMHGLELMGRRRALFGDAPVHARVAALASGVDAPEFEQVARNMSPRQALEVALESEIKAYEFYDQLLNANQSLSDALHPEVRELIMELRDEEAEHQRMLDKTRGWYQGAARPSHQPEVAAPSAAV